MIVVFISLILGIIFFVGYKKFKNEEAKKFFRYALWSLVILFILEFTLFNFRFYQSFFYKEIAITDYTLGDGIAKNSDGTLSVINEENNYIEIRNINQHLDNLYLNIDLSRKHSKAMEVWFGYTDGANRHYSYTKERKIEASQNNIGEILRLHLSGKTRRFRIYVRTLTETDTFTIRNISFNRPVSIKIMPLRLLSFLALAIFIYIFRPKSFIYKMQLFDSKAKKYIILTVLFELCFMLVISRFNNFFIKENFSSLQRYQYQLLAESFTKGKTHLDIEPSEVLVNMSNPYDKNARTYTFEDIDDDYIWDAAYFKGHYYVYFGVAPVFMFYLPAYAITGHHIKTSTCIIICMLATVIGLFLLLYELCRKWFRKISLGNFMAISLLFINACGLMSIMGRPDHYSLPILMGIMFSVYGLYAWIRAIEKNLDTKYLCIGSFCMATVAACRPQLLLTSFFAIPIFWDAIFKERKLFSKDSIKKTFAWVMPFVVIAILLMAYNYVRFGSPVDFGANYNLTTNDMTRRGFVLDRIPLGIYYYLFRPGNFILQFPFIARDEVATGYIGTTIFEDMGAGFVFANLLTILGLGIFMFKKEFSDKLPYKLGCCAVIFSIIIIIADTQMAGILPRYICDFGYLLYFATAIVVFNKLNKEKDNCLLNKIIFVALIIGFAYNILLILSDTNVCNSEIFFFLRRLVEFWK